VAHPIELSFRAGEVTLAGELLLPDHASRAQVPGDRLPWVLLLPSFLPRTRDGAFDTIRHPTWFDARTDTAAGLLGRVARALAAGGVASFRYDARGCGASGGLWEESGLFTRIDDARDAIGALRARDELDLRRCGILGHGEGALLAMAVVIGDPVLSALTLVAPPARSFRDLLRRGAARRAATAASGAHPFVDAIDRAAEELIERADRHEATMALRLADGEATLALAGWRELFDTPGEALATMVRRSTTIVHGSDDWWVHPDESLLIAATLAEGGNAPSRQVVVGADHDLAAADDATIALVADDLAGRLVPRELPPVLIALEADRPNG
jgi:alpha-beta hydrolase superfamily lysophospholipase